MDLALSVWTNYSVIIWHLILDLGAVYEPTTDYIILLCSLLLQTEEAKLITQLAENEAIDFGLFDQAYAASLDVSKFLHRYELCKLLKGPYDMEGACLTIEARSENNCHEVLYSSIPIL